MILRDDIETTLRAWDAYERARGCPPVVDFDCAPPDTAPAPVAHRLDAHERLTDLHHRAVAEGEQRFADRIGAHLAYLQALLGERQPLDAYVRATQGCGVAGWPDSHVTACRNRAIAALESLGVSWGPDTARDLDRLEGRVSEDKVADLMRAAAVDLEPAVRRITGATTDYDLTIESVDIDAYWSYWLDGAGTKVRLRLNRRHAQFTEVRLRQFALHEILGHALQTANWATVAATHDVDWIRVTAVHAQQQVLLEGLAQALPLFATPDDEAVAARVRLDHYLQLVRAELHQAINVGRSIADCVAHAHARVPFWTDDTIADALTDRGADSLLRSYLWSYAAGIDWFVALADTATPDTITTVLRTAYHQPLTPADLAELWPGGPVPGGSGP
ncbi:MULTISPECIES: hypothetical protein [Frankia]|uniref:DUF1704 domain-containing protein n=1 Tax=Frankia alni (strain DSM 45986 / CECT 9034 / ACN14a) TaxID=326424 RepID=Q0REN3_FRAAA|nr:MULTISPECIES: hypothetical protein [Frankia]CAJ64075.1 Conserved hypothetical protein [Frankia alni ACN14a]